ncbi:hypothetical protein BJF85_12865 [Saccharomonospora sp. CUA-673]|uniref:type II secretion system F family protein n=1 Tax=Saccharomonospora sp. CUA-673 TaxID=1904969 RepID=UPI000963E131|nr:type II secretion system F family protein [Saccharomonospora sp. CUA-673]OLT48401.1 hypothetical protein BJF85_12865 [Saccharomonospora sp. CUA-673]
MSATVCAVLGAALLILPATRTARWRAVFPPARDGPMSTRRPLPPVWWRRIRLGGRKPRPDPLRMAVTGDLLAACLRAGMPVPTAVRAVAPTAQPDAAEALRATADLLTLGAEPREAWEPAQRCPATTELATAARRAARSGSALAGVAEDLATRARATVGDVAEARAQRAGVLVAGPLGLCFLPAFLCLGIAPVVIGLAGSLSVF